MRFPCSLVFPDTRTLDFVHSWWSFSPKFDNGLFTTSTAVSNVLNVIFLSANEKLNQSFGNHQTKIAKEHALTGSKSRRERFLGKQEYLYTGCKFGTEYLKKNTHKTLTSLYFRILQTEIINIFYIKGDIWCLECQLNWKQFHVLCNPVRNAPVIVV